MDSGNRLVYIDGLRLTLSTLVIGLHVGQAYGLAGSVVGMPGAAPAAFLGHLFAVNRVLLQGLFFLVSGWFMVSAYERSGPRAFLRSRLRLGVPALLYGALTLVLARWNRLLDVRHLGNIQHLLVFSLGYSLWRWIRREWIAKPTAGLTGVLALLASAIILAASSLRGSFPAPLADAARDLAFFIVGGAAAACLRHPLPPGAGFGSCRGWRLPLPEAA